MTAETQRRLVKLKWLYAQQPTQAILKERGELLAWYKNAYKKISDDFGKMVIDALF